MAFKHLIKSKLWWINSMISNSVTWPVVCSNFITKISRSHLSFFFSLIFFICYFLEMSINSLIKHSHSSCFILMLISLILTLSFDSCGSMDNSNSWISFVNMLSTCTWSPFCFQLYIFRIYFEISWNLRHDEYNTSRRMNSASFFSFRNSLNFMNSTFVFKYFINSLSFNYTISIFASFANCHIFLEV